MTSNNAPEQTDSSETPTNRQQAGRTHTARHNGKKPEIRGSNLSGGLALILALISATATGYLWYTLFFQQQDLLTLDVPNKLTQIEISMSELSESLAATDDQLSTLADTQETLKSALEKIQADLGKNRAEWIVAEAEQLLLIANRRLQLARDANAALAALRAADRQLELLANPNLLPVRREIAREIITVESLEKNDIAGISLRLATLADSVNRLPLKQDVNRPAASNVESTTAAISSSETQGIWKDLLNLVRIRQYDQNQPPLLPPEQQFFLRENLRLMLYNSQHALLQGQAMVYSQNIKTASQWVQDYFDNDSQTVGALRTELERLLKTPIMTDLPDISSSLSLLRKATGRGSAL